MIAPSLLPASRTSMQVHSWEADPLPYRPRETLEDKRNDVSSDPCCFRAPIVVFFLGACRTNARANKEAEHSTGHHGGRHRVVQPQLQPASFNVNEVKRKLAPKD